jgi:hypothetical protein
VLIAIALLIGIAITLNFQSLQGLWQTGSEILRLRSSIQDKFNVRDVSINIRMQSGAAGKQLVVELRNPSFADLPDAELEAKAREIATFAFQEHAADREFTQIAIVVAESENTVLTVTEQREFSFSPGELSDTEAGGSANREASDARPPGTADESNQTEAGFQR